MLLFMELLVWHTALDQWTKAQDKDKVPTTTFLTDADCRDRWIKPEGTVLKINIDAALFTEAGNYSFACMVQDSRGMTLEAITSCREGRVSPATTEAIGVKEALSWIKRKSWQSVVVETDSLMVMQSVRNSVSMLSYFGTVIGDCRKMVEDFPDVAIVFIRRSANSVAHYLVRTSYYIVDRIIKSEDVSPIVINTSSVPI